MEEGRENLLDIRATPSTRQKTMLHLRSRLQAQLVDVSTELRTGLAMAVASEAVVMTRA